jgi:hypothetical protein
MRKFGMIVCLSLGIPGLLCSQEMDQIAEQNVFCGWQGKNASATVDQGFVGKASYLYWQAKEEGLDFVQSGDIEGGFPAPITANITLLDPISEWQSGFQVGIGYIFPQRSQWDVLLNWTWFHSNASNSTSLNGPLVATKTLRPTWLPFLMGPQVLDAAAQWGLKYDTLDLLLGRDFFLGKWLSFHPQAGVRAAHIHQDYQATYHGVYDDGMGGSIFLGETSFDANWTYNGMGVRFGTDGEWHINSYFSLVANGFLSILYGRYHLQESFQGGFPVGNPTPLREIINLNQHYYRLRTALETEIGFRSQTFFNNDKRRVVLGAYYGFSYWLRQNEMVNQFLVFNTTGDVFLTNLPTSGDLQLQGLRIELEVDF